jgi:FAD-dependent oxidoreductase domain-containing protein 1
MTRIVVIGGGVIGSSIAYHLGRAGAASDVTVIEPDPTYSWAASPRAVGGVRRLFGTAENVQMSQYGMHVYTNFDEVLRGSPVKFDTQFRLQGYMFMVWGRDAVAALEADMRMQRSLGVEVEVFDRAALVKRYPSFDFSDIDAATLSPGDGKIDPNAALMGFRRAAEATGVKYRKDRVVSLDAAGGYVTRVHLESGEKLVPEIVVNSANCWAPDICAMVGMKIPVAPLRRQMFFFDMQTPIERFPAMRDMSGFSVRPEGDGYLTGITRFEEVRGFNWNIDHDLFESVLWPRLAKRSRAFEAVKLKHAWVGHYDQCSLDGNPIIGRWEGHLENFIVVAGFSGHGLQHAPAVGRGIKELLLDGGYQSIDLSIFSYRRVVENKPIPDNGPTA